MIANLAKVNNNWVYQSNKLIEASHSYSVLEQKLIRMLASMIKKDDVDFKEYQFKAIDLSNILGTPHKNIYRDIDKITDKLMARVIKRKNDTDEKFKKFHLIKKVEFENGILTMKIDEEVKEFYLELKQYTKYQLKNIMQFKNSYSFRVYELLKQYEGIKSRELTIEDLRTTLDIKGKQYPKYSNLKQKVINIAQKEINSNTDISFEFEEIKTGRKVTSIRFYIKTNKTDIKANDEVCVTIEGKSTNEGEKCRTSLINEVKAIFKEDIEALEAKYILDTAKGDINIIKEKYAQAENVVKIDNIVGWMLKALKEDYKTAKRKVKVGSFNDYEQRAYDFDDLEKKLLDWDNNETDEVTGNEYQQLSIRDGK
ncbi:MAG: replication initiation protein [Spirochaetaceae bacterium]|nr:replication initiation protein [Spirochaetaceae bacterium]